MQKNSHNTYYILIADSGSTKTAWCLADTCGRRTLLHTRGINPAVQDDNTIRTLLTEELMPQLSSCGVSCHEIREVHFYGAGCIPSVCGRMVSLLREMMPEAGEPEVESDLLGAARALCGHAEGIACILGTGSNSCFYDGIRITEHVPPLGYILGDEGSGATLGKHFTGSLLKGLLAEELREAFVCQYRLTEGDIIRKVYREPEANRFLASLTVFMHEHRAHPDIRNLIVSSFEDFFRRNVSAYGRKGSPVHFTGSISFHFQEELEEAAHKCNYQIGKIIPSPIMDIVGFHLQNAEKTPAV